MENSASKGEPSGRIVSTGVSTFTVVSCISSVASTTSSSSLSSAARRAVPKYWLTPSIRVRIASKRLLKGRIYRQKATVINVSAPGVCSLLLDGDRKTIVDDVPERYLETVIPRDAAARVVVLSGDLKGELAIVVGKSNSKETATLQLIDDLSTHDLPFDWITETRKNEN